MFKYGNQNYWVEKTIIAFFIIWGIATIYAYANHTHKTHSLSRETKVVAITILAEARGEGEAGMYAVGACIAQRAFERKQTPTCLLYTSPSPRDQRGSRMPSSA